MNQSRLYSSHGYHSQLLLDPNTLRDDGTAALKAWAPSPDGSLLAYSISLSGSDWSTIYVRDVATAADLPGEKIEWVKFSGLTWTKDSKGFFYSRYTKPSSVEALEAEDKEDAAGTETQKAQHQRLFYHRVGSPAEEDTLVLGSPGRAEWMYGASVSWDGRLAFLSVRKDCDPVNALLVLPLTADKGLPVPEASSSSSAAAATAAAAAAAAIAGGDEGGLAEMSGMFSQCLPLVTNFEAGWRYVTSDPLPGDEGGSRILFRTNKDAQAYKVVGIDLPSRLLRHESRRSSGATTGCAGDNESDGIEDGDGTGEAAGRSGKRAFASADASAQAELEAAVAARVDFVGESKEGHVLEDCVAFDGEAHRCKVVLQYLEHAANKLYVKEYDSLSLGEGKGSSSSSGR